MRKYVKRPKARKAVFFDDGDGYIGMPMIPGDHPPWLQRSNILDADGEPFFFFVQEPMKFGFVGSTTCEVDPDDVY